MEIDYEKAYKEALERARKIHDDIVNNEVIGFPGQITDIFPELAESEDEKMLRTIIRGFESWKGNGNLKFNNINVDDILAYLEKQKAKERLNRMAPIYNDKESFESALEKAWKYYNKSASRTVDSFEDDYIECVFSKGFREGFLYREKQKESLHISEMCKEKANSFTDEGEKTRRMLDIITYKMSQHQPDIFTGEENEWFNAYLEKQKEQKPEFYPGDVIKCTSSGSLWVRCKDGDNIRSDGHTACIGGGFELASEEEAVQFFQELNENGYQWGCIKGRPMKKEQKQEWSEEDEINRQIAIGKLEGTEVALEWYVEQRVINWLKSLRPQSHWKPSEEQMEALNALNCHGDLSYVGQQGHLISLYNDLKKLM